eukprot:205256_1
MSAVNLIDNLIQVFTNGIVSFDTFSTNTFDCHGLKTRCDSTFRIINTMKYYSLFNKQNQKSQDHKNRLVQFANNTYRSLLDDFIHITQHHNNELDYISTSISKCNMQTCSLLSRCYGNRNNTETETHAYDFVFFTNLLDSIHCYLFHSYDIGLRIKPKQLHVPDDTTECSHDIQFANMQQLIRNQTKKLRALNDFNEKRFSNNKFNLNLNFHQNINQPIHDDNTCIDSLYEYLQERGHGKHLQLTYNLILTEEYDTDALLSDIDGYKESSNVGLKVNTTHVIQQQYVEKQTEIKPPICICGELLIQLDVKDCYIGENVRIRCDLCYVSIRKGDVYHCKSGKNDQKHLMGYDICLSCFGQMQSKTTAANQVAIYDIIKQYLKQTQLSQHSFGVGYRFYYWNYYKHNTKIAKFQMPDNRYDHCGYEAHELYVEAKYESIKYEILNNKYHQLTMYQFT